MSDDRKMAGDWWRTSIIDMQPGEIRLRGYPVEQIIGNAGLADVIWLMLRGDRPSQSQSRLLEAALVAGVDHGPQAPSIAVARSAMSCGVGLNNALASAVNTLGDVHGGAGEQAVAMYESLLMSLTDEDYDNAADELLRSYRAGGQKYLPGFGHRFHPIDPRAPRLMQLARAEQETGNIEGRYLHAALAIEDALKRRKKRAISMNIDGATAVIYAELGFDGQAARGLFCLSRSIGIVAHAREQQSQGQRNKGPIPKGWLWTYDGPQERRWSCENQESA